jgi:hypothetical protein
MCDYKRVGVLQKMLLELGWTLKKKTGVIEIFSSDSFIEKSTESKQKNEEELKKYKVFPYELKSFVNDLFGHCNYCRKSADKHCQGCKKVAYCSVDCQSAEWKKHKKYCKKRKKGMKKKQ